ncbi:MAG: polyprenyl synthetase family protein [Bacteroidales bacterium]|nr:polyprenyl synthetase family protein [Bacteroidales bacterium]
MDVQRIKDDLGDDWISFQQMMISKLDSEEPLLNKVNEYLFERSGKQIRPILALLSAHVCKGFCNENAIRCAAASEMIHTATLLHDDVADNADIRRGSPTIMSLFTPSASVLIGDFWLARAIRIIVCHCKNEIILCFSKCIEDLAEGEMLQMQKAETLDTTEEDYISIISRKTASLFCAAVKSAAYAVDAQDNVIDIMDKYAYHLGLAFQIRDDILDYSPSSQTGKMTGIDIVEKKITLPLLMAFKNAPAEIVEQIKNIIREIGFNNEEDKVSISEVLKFVYDYDGLECAQKRLEQELRNAIEAISIMEDSFAKKHLIELAEYVGIRKN